MATAPITNTVAYWRTTPVWASDTQRPIPRTDQAVPVTEPPNTQRSRTASNQQATRAAGR